MPPRKDKSSKEEIRQLCIDYGIQFRGPVPSRDWPKEQKHHFQAIRDIELTRYESYIVDQQVPKARREEFRKRVSHIRRKVYGLLDDEKPNESTWRDLETTILERLDRLVICENCNHEAWISDFEADFLNKESQAVLATKRQRRRLCSCENKKVHSKAAINDHEYGPLFSEAKDAIISHALGETFQKGSVSMKPDRIIGLHAPSAMPRDAFHFPVIGTRLLLPFLVLEAKKEGDVPGFRATQHQTAFVIRRFLKAQDSLCSRRQSSEFCLVWFFANQGELWRLHAGVYDNGSVKIFDLWQGTIQSQDGALQMLLIVDFIWSWARDVYRPSVWKLLSESIPDFQDFSTVPTDRFRQSTLLSCESTPAPTTYSEDWMQIDGVSVDAGHAQGHVGVIGPEDHETEERELFILQGATNHTFLRWAVGHQNAPSWTKLGSIRHSNIVEFEFRYFNILRPEVFEVKQAESDDRRIFEKLFSLSFWILPEQISELATLWTRSATAISKVNIRNATKATFFVQTYCDHTTWQIRRVMNCMIWKIEPFPPFLKANVLPAYLSSNGKYKHCEMKNIERAFRDTQQISGRDSVWFALRTVSMVLVPSVDGRGPGWIPFNEVNLPDHATETLKGFANHADLGDIVVNCVKICYGLWQIDERLERRFSSTIPGLGQETRNGNSMLAVRPSGWSTTICPLFCLFILKETPEDKAVLHKLLEEAVALKNFYGEGRRWGPSGWKTLHEWRAELKHRG